MSYAIKVSTGNGPYRWLAGWDDAFKTRREAEEAAKRANKQEGWSAKVVQVVAVGDRVEAGEGDDHDTGRVESIDGDAAFVAWDSGVKTPAGLNALRLI